MKIFKRFLTQLIKLRCPNLKLGADVILEPSAIYRGGEIFLDDGCRLRLGAALIPSSGSVIVGKRTTINQYCILHGENGIKIGNDCLIAPRVSIFSSNHDFSRTDVTIRSQGATNKGGVMIGDDVWIGTGAIILDGVRIGDGCVVGAGAVVTRSIPEYSVAIGNPARVCKLRKPDENYMK